ncbi:hypothetical protein HPB48_013214 [Haemaphysalis longicornis]|uniref:Endonuclease/exonuclease/phosphatase domain-containing protein n=1 Tax=Haemaphysalis longicornis TaxID=44386 RepID=A0A9J6GT43_HAELO|nr:hypothetical protein HPB48_013214 [Haemaphysalis longicornis]
MTHLRSLYPGDAILIGGDFNASNVIWGYPRNTSRGAQLEREAQAANLTLVNDLEIPTRTALHSRQKGTTLDLTWTSHNLCSSWSCENDPWGSDHYPIWVSLKHGLKKRKRKVRCTNWDLFRQHLADPSSNSSEISALVEAMQQAMILATQEIDLPEKLLTPDKHMLNLWETRDQLHAQYLANGRRYKDRLKVRQKTAQIRRHAKMVARDRWQTHCASFSNKTGLHTLWNTFKALQGKTKTI